MSDELGQSTGVEETPAAGVQNTEPSQEPASSVQNPASQVQTPSPQNQPAQGDGVEQAFAKRLSAERQKIESEYSGQRDKVISELLGHQGITSWDQYQQARAQAEAAQKAQQMNVDPKFYQEFEGLKQKLDGYEQERKQTAYERTLMQQEQSLASDPNVGEFFNTYKDDVKSLAKQAHCDYDIALTLLLRDKIPQLLNSTKSTAEQTAIKNLINNSQSSPGSLSQGGEPPKSDIKSMPKADFEEMIKRVKRGGKIEL